MKLRRRVRNACGRAWLRAFGWEIDGGAPPVEKAVVVAAPHTSNWDLPFTLAIAWSLDLDMKWVGKHTLFELPVWGPFLRSLGGIGVDRRTKNDAVKAIADVVKDSERILLIVPPEGTRGVAKRWKTGFYWIAVEAEVPIVLGFLDFAKKRGGLGELLHPTGDIAHDFELLREFYRDKKGKHPERQGDVSLGEVGVPTPMATA
ncbi:1-acyl-sn-glycerol-3-phosphate acyltransferase [Sandaracinus amylolyticus]|uniref:1-acyl-sn-glycerol-3-phosphate acyltransferase n=1 Tax=Sandaracinus amylolyticus TaxID=927083 RepID=UPI00069EF002|nr:1-acyl-sn-glycerol-3-phosphate acyltransferase [Sandaracinus amylolyticus]